MREIKFKYGYSDGITMFEKAFTLDEIEQGLQFDETSDSPLLKNHKIVHKRQYTGLKDKNGVDIYEGDIIELGKIDGKIFVGIVVFNEDIFDVPCFCIQENEDTFHTFFDNNDDERFWFEVVGNIYENKELLGS